ncbi:hypothetical protein BT67DRAFT_34291 [Trichocladium antarcticum]|uniref:Uncharacterized protein n=1 Tax=Trichocladium antarcticum TaxID=1450529 RepID=A0AAN6UJJ4_9PEZI|nr:hypothetical protein BT67DRAFT_34291 [Trichocladium antarcticum]
MMERRADPETAQLPQPPGSRCRPQRAPGGPRWLCAGTWRVRPQRRAPGDVLQVRWPEPLCARLPGPGHEVLCVRQARAHLARLHGAQRRAPQPRRQDVLPVRRGRPHLARLPQDRRQWRDAGRRRSERPGRSGAGRPAHRPGGLVGANSSSPGRVGERVARGAGFSAVGWLLVDIFFISPFWTWARHTTRLGIFPRRSRFWLVSRWSPRYFYSGQTMNGKELLCLPGKASFSRTRVIWWLFSFSLSFLIMASLPRRYLEIRNFRDTHPPPPLLWNVRNGCRGPLEAPKHWVARDQVRVLGHAGRWPRQTALAGQEAGSEAAGFRQGAVVFV